MKYAKIGTALSVVAVLASIVLFFAAGLNFGIDFRGGTLIEVRMNQPVNIGELRNKVSNLGLGSVEIQAFGRKTDASIRFETQKGGEKAQQNAIKKVKATLGGEVKEYLKVDVVGPKVSGELAQEGTIAVVVAILAVMIYIWFRFEWQFAVGAVLSLTHDVLLTIGIFSILQLDFGLSIVAAILTIVGYSLNDTVVVYDRIRENLRKYKKKSLTEVINMSLNQMLRRTIITSVSTLLALVSLYVFGGDVLRGFTFTMIWGVVVGTYSSIFIAAPLLIYMGAKISDSVRDEANLAPSA
jgi:preprotein translocase SecF subunit